MIRFFVLMLFLLIGSAYGLNSWNIVPVDTEPILDGILDDDCWNAAEPRTGFTQRDPNPGEASTEQTIMYAVYTDNALYVAFECLDSEADNIVARLRRRDSSIWGDDNVDIWFDPTGSGLQLYYFSTNPAGVKYDALNALRGLSSNREWDAHWDVATLITDRGWIAEFEIPFSNFKFEKAGNDSWLFNAGRVIRRKGEETYASPVAYEHNMFYLEDAVHLTGIRNIASGMGVKIVPYSKSDYRWSEVRVGDSSDKSQVNAGADIDLDLGSTMTLATTFRPDFAEIDLDPNQYQIGIGEIYVSETRPFFLRDANYFRTINLMPFYSRRVGKRLYDENGLFHDAEIIAGGRLTGNIGSMGVGAFYAHTSAALWEPESDWGIGRVRYNLGSRSFIGMSSTVRSTRDVEYGGSVHPGYFFGSFGVDYEYYFTDTWNTWGTVNGMHDSRLEDNRIDGQYGINCGMAWRRKTFEIWGNYADYGTDFSLNETGFSQWRDSRNMEAGINYRLGFGNALFRNLGVSLNSYQRLPRDWGRGMEQYRFTMSTQTNFNWHFNLEGAYGIDNLYYNPGHADGFGHISFRTSTDPAGVMSVSNNCMVASMPDYTTGGWGTLLHDDLGVSLIPAPELQINAGVEYNSWRMRDEDDVSDYDLVMWRGTVEYLHSREVFLRLFGQGSTYSDVYSFRALIGWEYQPDSNIYLAYEQWRDNSESDFRVTNQGLFLKVDRFLHF